MPYAAKNGSINFHTFIGNGKGLFTKGLNALFSDIAFTKDTTGQGTGKFTDVNGDGTIDYVMPYAAKMDPLISTLL